MPPLSLPTPPPPRAALDRSNHTMFYNYVHGLELKQTVFIVSKKSDKMCFSIVHEVSHEDLLI